MIILVLSACAQARAPDAELARPTAPSSEFREPVTRKTSVAAEHGAEAHTVRAPAIATASAEPVAADPPDAPLVDGSGQPLPQTDDRPSASSAAFGKRMERLARAIVEANPELALSTFFPSEGNRLGYFRVLRSTPRFVLADGREKKLERTSLISWRGEWYVVHVAGFK